MIRFGVDRLVWATEAFRPGTLRLVPAVLCVDTQQAATGGWHADAYGKLGVELEDSDRYEHRDPRTFISGWRLPDGRFHDGLNQVATQGVTWVDFTES